MRSSVPKEDRFNGKFRDECLNEHWFASVTDGSAMIEKSSALRIQRLALDAIVALTESLNVAIESASSPDTLDQLKRGVGLSIGTIDSELLSVLYKMYPEIDHLKQ